MDVPAANILYGRRLRTRVPNFSVPEAVEVRNHPSNAKAGHYVAPLVTGDTFRVREDTPWNKKACVIKEVKPRSHEVFTEDNKVLRRNRRHLLKSPEDIRQHYSDDEDTVDTEAGTSQATDSQEPPTRSSISERGSPTSSSSGRTNPRKETDVSDKAPGM